MIEIRRILCPVDFSEFSRHSLAHAVALARWYEAQITVFHAYSAPSPPVAVSEVPTGIPMLPPVQPDEVMAEVRRFCAPWIADGASPEFVVQEGPVVKAIVEQAERMRADLMIMGTHGRGGFERLILGSVTEKVMRKARCPVLTLPPPIEHPPDRPLFKTILCPVDFSDSSRRALEYAFSLAEEADARLILLHAIEASVESAHMGEAAHFTVPEYHRYLEQDAMARLQAAVPDNVREWCTPETMVVSGKAYREILRVAQERGAELIVMGVHGGGVFDRLLLGSTTAHVVRAAGCPVLTLRE